MTPPSPSDRSVAWYLSLVQSKRAVIFCWSLKQRGKWGCNFFTCHFICLSYSAPQIPYILHTSHLALCWLPEGSVGTEAFDRGWFAIELPLIRDSQGQLWWPIEQQLLLACVCLLTSLLNHLVLLNQSWRQKPMPQKLATPDIIVAQCTQL